MINRLIPALGIVFVAACSSPPLIAPTSVLQPTGPSSSVLPSNGPGHTPFPIDGTSISAGSPVQGTIVYDDPACFPDWDASGRCRQYDLTASADGTIVATLKWPGPSRGLYDPEVFLVAPDGTFAYSRDEWPERHASLPSKAAMTYRVVVISYGPFPATFQLIAELRR